MPGFHEPPPLPARTASPPPRGVPPPLGVPPRPERPADLLGLAILWSVAAICASVLMAILLARLPLRPALDHRVAALATAATLGLVLLAVARWQGRVLGRGDVRRGLGAGPIRRPLLLLGLAGLVLVLPTAWILLLRSLLHPEHQAEAVTDMVRAARLGPAMQLATWAVMVVLAPLAEELFYRGWLWTGLRRRWGLAAAGAGTALPWLVMHMPDGALRPLFLLPAAVLFSLAREHCGGVWASLTLHLLNNAVSVGVLTLLL